MRDQMWLKRVLIPFWVVDIVWLAAILAISGINVYVLKETDFEGSEESVYIEAVDISAIILITMSSLSIIFDIATIVLFARHKLGAITFLTFACIKAFFWTAIFCLDVADAAAGVEVGFAFLWSVPLMASSVGQVIYGGVIMHRKRKGRYSTVRGNYAGVEGGNIAHNGQYTGYDSPPRGSYAAYNPYGAPPNPFRDASREPSRERSPAPEAEASQPLTGGTHPAYRKSGEVGEEHLRLNEPNAAQQSFEMQGVASYRNQ